MTVRFAPVWILRRTFRDQLWEIAVDGLTGVILRGRAPVRRDNGLGSALAAIYLLAFGTALVGRLDANWLFLMAGYVAHLFPFLIVGAGLSAALAAYAWDRVRYRWEWVFEGEGRRRSPVNRPERTLPDRARTAIFGVFLRMMRNTPSLRRNR